MRGWPTPKPSIPGQSAEKSPRGSGWFFSAPGNGCYALATPRGLNPPLPFIGTFTPRGWWRRRLARAPQSVHMKRQFDTETTIIVLSLGVVYLGYLRIIDWMPELGLIGNLATGDVSVFAGVEVKYHFILMLC